MARRTKKKPPATSSRRISMFAPALYLIAGVASVFINFPPGDSWTHGWTVDQWLKGNFIFNDWSSAVAFPQQILGWLVCLGSDSVQWWKLSLLTSVVTVSGVLIAANLPSKLFPDLPELKKWIPLFAIVMLATPFTLKIGAGFMTDGYYFLLLTGALWILIDLTVRAEEIKDAQWFGKWVAYGLIAIAASLQRSHGFFLLLIPVIWIILARVIDSYHGRRTIWSTQAVIHPIFVCVLGLMMGLVIQQVLLESPARSGEVTKEVMLFWAGKLMPYSQLGYDRFRLLFGIFQHLGLALLPIAYLARQHRLSEECKLGKKPINWWYVIAGAAFVIFTLWFWIPNSKDTFPYLGNSITEDGFGPRAATIFLTSRNTPNPLPFMILTLVSTFSGVLLIWVMSRTAKIRGIDWRSPSTLIGLIGLAHLGLIFLNPHFFDRYLLPLMPFCYIWFAPILSRAAPKLRMTGWFLAVILMAWSLYGTYDYLNWTKAKWDIAAELRADGIPANQIVGGYEIDGFFNYTNENYPGMEFEDDPMLPWWVDRLGLEITPEYIVTERGPTMNYTPYRFFYTEMDVKNSRMTVWQHNTSQEE